MADANLTDAAPLPWLLDLATRQESTGPDPGDPLHDPESQMTYLQVPSYELAIDSQASIGTKKADRETRRGSEGLLSRVATLVVTNERDVGADFLVRELANDNLPVVRLNSERATEWRLSLEPGDSWRVSHACLV